MTRPYGSTVAAIERLLLDHGSLTTLELSRLMGVTRSHVNPVVRRMLLDKRLHVASWTRQVEGSRDYLRPEYDLGDWPNKPKPRLKTAAASTRDYRVNLQRNAWGRVSSVFNIGDRRL